MKTEKYRDQFQRTCFKPALEELLRQTGENLSKNTESIIPQIIKPVARLMNSVGKMLSEEITAGRSVWISLSFLRISLLQKKSVILAEVYKEVPYIKPPILAQEIPSEWMFSSFGNFQEDMSRRVEDEVLKRYIRKPELKSYESAAVSTILRYIFFYMKYIIRNLEDEQAWTLFKQEADLTISFGEYMDWQLPIAAIRPEIDLFLCDKETDRSFRRFKGLYYEGNDFSEWILDDCVFEQCKFRKMEFIGTKFRNTRFMDCTFEGCTFQEVSFMGASILNCMFGKVKFVGCNFEKGWQKEEEQMMYYTLGTFRWCIMDGVQWENTETTEDMFIECHIL